MPIIQHSIGARWKWDERFMRIAEEIATWSKDRSRGVGCVVISPDRDIKATGYNGFPRGINDWADERHERPAKYDWTEHAERNAIFAAAKHGTSLAGCTMYVPWFPCVDCARAIIQAGIAELVCFKPDDPDSKWAASHAAATEMLHESKVAVYYHVRAKEQQSIPA